jgi:hypothetical protein
MWFQGTLELAPGLFTEQPGSAGIGCFVSRKDWSARLLSTTRGLLSASTLQQPYILLWYNLVQKSIKNPVTHRIYRRQNTLQRWSWALGYHGKEGRIRPKRHGTAISRDTDNTFCLCPGKNAADFLTKFWLFRRYGGPSQKFFPGPCTVALVAFLAYTVSILFESYSMSSHSFCCSACSACILWNLRTFSILPFLYSFPTSSLIISLICRGIRSIQA